MPGSIPREARRAASSGASRHRVARARAWSRQRLRAMECQPGGELGIASKQVETGIRLDEDVVRQVWRQVAVAGESITPRHDAGTVTTEQLVEKLRGSDPRPAPGGSWAINSSSERASIEPSMGVPCHTNETNGDAAAEHGIRESFRKTKADYNAPTPSPERMRQCQIPF